MKILELMHSLDEAYHRFGDIEIFIDFKYKDSNLISSPQELITESDQFIIKCE